MVANCFSCNAIVSKGINIFEDDCPLQSRSKISETLSEIVEKQLNKSSCHSEILCRTCYATVSEFDSLKIRLQVLKNSFIEDWKKTLRLNNINYDTYGTSPVKHAAKKIVLPASKLQPVPANFLLDIGKNVTVSRPQLTLSNVASLGMPQAILKPIVSKPSVNLRVTVGSTVLTQSLSSSAMPTSQPKLTLSNTNTITSPLKTDFTISDKIISSLVTPNRMAPKKKPVLSFNVNSLPKDLLSSTVGKGIKVEQENNGDQEMEIDEDCTLAVAVATNDNGKLVFESSPLKNKTIDLKSKSNFFDVGLLLSQDGVKDSEKDGTYILDKLKILNEGGDDEEDDTIVMEEGERTTIIRMGAGQRVLYDGKKISLVEKCDNDVNENVDSLDSNDDSSQIELQVSGDEEIANALITAAQHEGGAFIKVDSGEMYRVESIKRSQVEDDNDTANLQNIVERENDRENIYKCLLCERNVNKEEVVKGDPSSIMAHLKNEHNARAYICPVCGVVIRKRTEYSVHVEKHASENRSMLSKSKLHECTECGKKYNSRTILNEHMNVHYGTRPYTCAVCEKTFASKYTHQAHLKTHSMRPRPFKCEQCNKTFFTQQNLNQHEKTHSGLKEFICKVCNKAFATQHNLEVHGVIHSGRRPYSCNDCSKAFARRAELRDHIRTHTGERPFACDICGATFTQRSNLHSHKRATHLDDKRYECQQCPKRFKRRRLLDYHVKAAHTGERPLQCEICKATFVYPEHYKKHARIHSGEKPYHCEVCGKSFNSRDNRNMHRFVHSDKKPYECLTCGAGYMRKQLLYSHMHSTGHVAESIVVNQPRVIKTIENGINAPLVDVHAIELKTDKFPDEILATTEELDSDDNQVDTTDDLNGLIETSTEDRSNDQAQLITTDQKGGTMRLIQIQLPDGNTGWVAINQ
ncbi:unnamed protein product [Diatraea saccharalis]|uniref:C2H2-type domain-containing protein n=1 Tax=Diatraea saccharalis TaxID=40085 RepID=A0A9N9R4M0_9NEOP|nr:unnamed protein product [Diatraea saccharalis]